MPSPRSTVPESYSQLEVVPTEQNREPQLPNVPPGNKFYSHLEAASVPTNEKEVVAAGVIPIGSYVDHTTALLSETDSPRKRRRKWTIWILIITVVVVGAVLGGVLGTVLSKHSSKSSQVTPGSPSGSSTLTIASSAPSTLTTTATPTMSGTATVLSIYSNPTAVSWGSPHLEVFAGSSQGVPYWKYRNTTTSWSPQVETLESLDGALAPFEQAIAAVARSVDNVDIFVAGTDFAMYHRYHTTDLVWGPSDGWENLEGILSTGPTVVSWASDRLDIFVLGEAPVYGLYQMSWSSSTGWSNWNSIPGGSWEVLPPTAVAWGQDRLDVFLVDTNTKALHHTYWDGTSWQPSGSFANLGGYCTSRPVALSRGSGLIDVFVRGGDATIWQLSYSNSAWGKWTAVAPDTTIQGDPEAVSWGSNSIELFAWGADSSLLYKRFDTVDGVEAWIPSTGFQVLGSGLTGPPKAVSDGEESVHVFAYLQDDQLGHLAWDESTGAWSPGDDFEILGTP